MQQRNRGLLVFVIALLSTAALWLLCTGSTRLHECIVGGVCTACAMTFATIAYKHQTQRYDFTWADVTTAWRTPWYLVSGLWEITILLGKDIAGQRAESIFRVCGFRTAKEEPRMVTRRALATAYTTIAPNFIVIGIDYQQSRMLFHQIQRSEVPVMTKKLGAEVGTREGNAGDASARAQGERPPR